MQCVVCGKPDALSYAAGYLCDRETSDCYWMRSGHIWYPLEGPIEAVLICRVLVEQPNDHRVDVNVVTFRPDDPLQKGSWKTKDLHIDEFRARYTYMPPTLWDRLMRSV